MTTRERAAGCLLGLVCGDAIVAVETALHDGLTAPDAEEALVSTASRGGDAPTVGAVTGALAGARFGADHLPPRWLDGLAVDPDDLTSLAAELDALAGG